jgi:hypothetical protein
MFVSVPMSVLILGDYMIVLSIKILFLCKKNPIIELVLGARSAENLVYNNFIMNYEQNFGQCE